VVYKEYKMGAYNLHTIKTDKFKLCHMEIIFRNNAVKEDVTIRNVLFDVLTESNKTYPTRRDFLLRQEDLYNAFLYSATSKVGNGAITNICLDFINPKYTDTKILQETLYLPFDMIFNPLAENKEFDTKTLDLIKERLASEIKAVKENARKYAMISALKTLGEDTPSSYDNIGQLNALDEITASSLYQYYEKILKHDYIDIYIIGDLDMDKVAEMINEYADFKIIKNHQFELYVKNEKRKPIVLYEKFLFVHTNIVLILALNKLTTFEQKYVANLFNMILGGGSLETKLYKKLRNEHSLCYNVGSVYRKYDGLIVISTSVDINAKEKAIKLIKETIKEMSRQITDEELSAAKESMISALTMGMDNIGRIVDNYFFQNISDLDDYETRITEFKKVTIQDLERLSKKISISTIYALEGGEES